MTKAPRWVLVADAGSARAYRVTGRDLGLEPIKDFELAQHLPRTSEILSDGPGRVQESASSARHSVSLPKDPHRELKRQFARQVVTELDRRHAAGAFASLVVIAAPAFLGDLRQEASARLRAAIAGEIAKDLTKSPLEAVKAEIEAMP